MIDSRNKRFNHWHNLRNCYRRLFQKGELYDGKLSSAAVQVLQDLRPFCRVDTSCVMFDKDGRVDTHATAVIEGRREVWLKIVQTLNLTDEQLNQILTGAKSDGTRDTE